MSDQPVTQRIATKALIVNDNGQVLILREADTYEEGTNISRYGLPGGRIDPGEPFLEGLKREVYEETGLDIEVKNPLYVGEWWPVIKGNKNQIVAIFFVCKALNSNVKLSEEHDDFQWITPEQAADYDFMPPDDKVIKTYAQNHRDGVA